MAQQPEPQIGDVIVTRGRGWVTKFIRLGAALQDQPNLTDHVAVVHHRDEAGTLWVIEGRPGGVGYANAAPYIASPWTVLNTEQPKTDEQRYLIATVLEGMIGTPYDWRGIVADAMAAIRVNDIWARDWEGHGPPAQVVCSSLAGWVYRHAGLEFPTRHPVRFTTPADWAEFIILHDYNL